MEYKDYSNQKLTQKQLREILAEAVLPKRHKLEELELLDKNANIMPKQKYKTLVENIKYDGRLTQWPFVMKLPNGKYGVPSGNHRVKAALEAGIEEDWCITCEVTLPEDEARRIELSHNTIKGDLQNVVLLELASEFGDIELLRLSGAHFEMDKLDDEKLEFKAIDTGGLDFREVLIYFTQYEVSKLDQVLVDLERRLEDSENPTYIAEKKRYKKLVDAITEAKRGANVKSTSTVLNFMIDYIYQHREDFTEWLSPEEKNEE